MAAYPTRAVKFAVRECTDYSRRITPTHKEMEEIALIIPVASGCENQRVLRARNTFAPQDENDENDQGQQS